MSISSQVDKTGPFLITALPQVIPVGFPFQASSDFRVINGGSTGTPIDPYTTLVLNSDYTVTGGGYNAANEMQTGSITVFGTGASSVAVGANLVILRDVPVNQTTSFQASGPLSIQQIEQALDKQATLSQQADERSGRCLRFEANEFLDGTMVKTLRSGKVVGFDSSGNLTYYGFVGGSVLPQSITGTANVLVNGTQGIATTGSVTLSTPQGITTTSSPQFLKMGLGTAPTTTSDLVIQHSVPSAVASACVLVQGSVVAPAATDLHPNAFRDTTSYTSTVAADAYASYDAEAGLYGTLAYNHFIGFQARQGYQGSGILSRLEGFTGFLSCNNGNVTEARVFYVPDMIVGGGTVDHYTGLFIDQLSKGTTRHAIYHNGTDPWFSAGGQIFTSVLLTTPAGATTCMMGCTFDQSSQTGMAVMNKNATATGTFVSFCNSGGTVQGTITQTSSVLTAYNTASDARMKENVRDFTDSGRIIDALRPRLYDWKNGDKDSIGFLAQEENAVDPVLARIGAVTVGDDHPTTIEKMWQRSDAALVPILVAEIKSLRTRVATLENN